MLPSKTSRTAGTPQAEKIKASLLHKDTPPVSAFLTIPDGDRAERTFLASWHRTIANVVRNAVLHALPFGLNPGDATGTQGIGV